KRLAGSGRNKFIILRRARADGGDGFARSRLCRLDEGYGCMGGPPMLADAAAGIDGLDAERPQRGLRGAHRKYTPNSFAKKSFKKIDSWVTNPLGARGCRSTRSMTQQTLEAVVTWMADQSLPLMDWG